MNIRFGSIFVYSQAATAKDKELRAVGEGTAKDENPTGSLRYDTSDGRQVIFTRDDFGNDYDMAQRFLYLPDQGPIPANVIDEFVSALQRDGSRVSHL